MTTQGHGVEVCAIMGCDRHGGGGQRCANGGRRDPRGGSRLDSRSQHPHRACLVHIAAVPLLHGPQVCVLLLQAVLKLLDSSICWGNKVAPEVHAKLRPPPAPPPSAVEHCSLLPSVGGSSSSMYSRFRCSSRSASRSFCLWAGDQQQRWQRAFPAGWKGPAWPEAALPASQHSGRVRWPQCLLCLRNHNPPHPSSGPVDQPPSVHFSYFTAHILTQPPPPTASLFHSQPLSSILHPTAGDLSRMQISCNKRKC